VARAKPKPPLRRRLTRILLRSGLAVAALVLLVTTIQVASLRYIDPPFTFRMAWGWAAGLLSGDGYQAPVYRWVALDQISPHLRKAVLAAEDQRFLTHRGFDVAEIRNALEDMVVRARFRGASTITMQVARSVYLLPSRSLARKLAEAYYTVLIELMWDKRRILEMYLNTVDWGDAVVGAQAAARSYFQTSADRLDPRQAALLAAILPNPHLWSPVRPSRYLRKRQRRILRDMRFMPLVGGMMDSGSPIGFGFWNADRGLAVSLRSAG
jgi:monofunctional biosynthetic peptidoglycan transglycosylase